MNGLAKRARLSRPFKGPQWSKPEELIASKSRPQHPMTGRKICDTAFFGLGQGAQHKQWVSQNLLAASILHFGVATLPVLGHLMTAVPAVLRYPGFDAAALIAVAMKTENVEKKVRTLFPPPSGARRFGRTEGGHETHRRDALWLASLRHSDAAFRP
jgi:hypothetical protein